MPMLPVLIVAARFYEDIAEALLRGARAELERAGLAFEVAETPGALEIPAAVAMAHGGGRYAGYVALGCVIRGETSHYDVVCAESARGLNELAIRHGLAIGNGILTVENEAQAWERALPERRDKGGDAARACVAMLKWRAAMMGGA